MNVGISASGCSNVCIAFLIIFYPVMNAIWVYSYVGHFFEMQWVFVLFCSFQKVFNLHNLILYKNLLRVCG